MINVVEISVLRSITLPVSVMTYSLPGYAIIIAEVKSYSDLVCPSMQSYVIKYHTLAKTSRFNNSGLDYIIFGTIVS